MARTKHTRPSLGPVVATGRRMRARFLIPAGFLPGDQGLPRRSPVAMTGSLPAGSGHLVTRRNGDSRLHLELDRHTPPGTYSGAVTAGGCELPLTWVVPERTSVRLRPETIHLNGDPGSVHTVSVVVENRGNTSIALPSRSAGFLAPKGRLCASFRQASRGSSDEDTAVGFLDRFARAVASSIHHERALLVRSRDGDTTIPPGEARVVALELTIPKRLPAGQYRARVPLGRTGVRVFVATSAQESQEGEES